MHVRISGPRCISSLKTKLNEQNEMRSLCIQLTFYLLVLRRWPAALMTPKVWSYSDYSAAKTFSDVWCPGELVFLSRTSLSTRCEADMESFRRPMNRNGFSQHDHSILFIRFKWVSFELTQYSMYLTVRLLFPHKL